MPSIPAVGDNREVSGDCRRLLSHGFRTQMIDYVIEPSLQFIALRFAARRLFRRTLGLHSVRNIDASVMEYRPGHRQALLAQVAFLPKPDMSLLQTEKLTQQEGGEKLHCDASNLRTLSNREIMPLNRITQYPPQQKEYCLGW